VTSEPDQMTNACAGRHVRKRWKTWPVNNAWYSTHVFICGPTANC